MDAIPNPHTINGFYYQNSRKLSTLNPNPKSKVFSVLVCDTTGVPRTGAAPELRPVLRGQEPLQAAPAHQARQHVELGGVEHAQRGGLSRRVCDVHVDEGGVELHEGARPVVRVVHRPVDVRVHVRAQRLAVPGFSGRLNT